MALLMPLFFALTGLTTTASAFTTSGLGALALILGVAVFGKIAGGALGARLGGHGWRHSLATGALMNSRGLMELIVIKIGLDAGLIGQELFTILLLMALMTTAMTAPLVTLFSARTSLPTPNRPRSHSAGCSPACDGFVPLPLQGVNDEPSVRSLRTWQHRLRIAAPADHERGRAS
jgi:Kef-type K+ transport system membrane component KefB